MTAPDLGSGSLESEGSTPFARTTFNLLLFSVVRLVRQQNERHETKTTKLGCAGKSSNNGFKTPKFPRVEDSKEQTAAKNYKINIFIA